MEALKNIYLRALEGVGDMPSWKKDWRWIAIYSICIYAIVLAFRMSFAGRWDHPELWVNGERILATHDAYFWLAKAKGVGMLSGYPLAQAAHEFNSITGVGLGTIGFWAPAFVASFVGVACLMWGWFLAGRNAGILAGLVGSLTPGFFYRSRLGYFDTDMFTLLAPMLGVLLLASWASRLVHRGWFMSPAVEDRGAEGQVEGYWLAFAAGLFMRFSGCWHQDIIHFFVLSVFLAVVVLLVNGRPGLRCEGFYGLIILVLAAFPGTSYGHLRLWPVSAIPVELLGLSRQGFAAIAGVIISAALAVFLTRWGRQRPAIASKAWFSALLFIAVVLSTNIAQLPISTSIHKLLVYLSLVNSSVSAPEAISNGPLFPSIVQSIIEAKQVALPIILERSAFIPFVGWIALLCTVVGIALRPVAIFLLPLIVLQIASVKIGIRFSMFGGAALIVCMGVCLHWCFNLVAKNSSKKLIFGLCFQMILGSLGLVYCYTDYSRLPLTPVLPRQHAEALIELGKKSSPEAMVWTWWDWGYASQYYAGRETVVDGGKHSGRDVFPVGYAMSSLSLEKSNRMIAYSAQFPVRSKLSLGLSPAISWDQISRNKINETLLEQLSRFDYPTSSPQYIVVSWKDVAIAKWITFFGNWDLQNGTTREASVSNYAPGQLGFNVQQGAVMNRKGGGGLVSNITILDSEHVETIEYYMNKLSPRLLPKQRYLVVNKVSRQSVLMDRIAHRSTMMRLLIGDPDDPEITPYFKLVVDKLPFARIYEVVQ